MVQWWKSREELYTLLKLCSVAHSYLNLSAVEHRKECEVMLTNVNKDQTCD